MALFVSKKLVRAIADTMQRAPQPTLRCVDAPRLARALREAGVEVVEPGQSEAPAGAVLVRELSSRADWQSALEGERRHLDEGGIVICLDRGKAHEISGRLLCSGYSDIWQSHIARKILSSARLCP